MSKGCEDETDECSLGEGGQECRCIFQNAGQKAITRFDKIHMGTPAFSSDEDCPKDMGIMPFVIPQKS